MQFISKKLILTTFTLILLIPTYSWAAKICGRVQKYGTCRRNYTCIRINGVDYRFSDRRTRGSALSNLHFAVDKALILGKRGHLCLYLGKNQNLLTAITRRKTIKKSRSRRRRYSQRQKSFLRFLGFL